MICWVDLVNKSLRAMNEWLALPLGMDIHTIYCVFKDSRALSYVNFSAELPVSSKHKLNCSNLPLLH